MKGFLSFFLACAAFTLVAVVQNVWLGLAFAAAMLWFLTPLESKPRTRVVKRRGERGY